MQRVCVLKGGRSFERQVSLRSGARVQEALERLGHDVSAVDVGPDLVTRLRAEAPDTVFIALHGVDGEDGTVQELLEVLGIPYTGSGVAACVRAADKVLAKHVMRDHGIPTPDFVSLTDAALEALGAADAMPFVEERLAFPIVVKPARQGSALGIKFARTPEEIPAALVAAFSYDAKVLLERHVAGRELAVSVLDDGAQPVALPVVEALPDRRGQEAFYDFEARYEIGATRFRCPAQLEAEVAERAAEIALSAYRALGCRGVARVDLILADPEADPAGALQVLEVNPIPGLTETSLLPQAAEAAGISFDELVARILASARTRESAPTPG